MSSNNRERLCLALDGFATEQALIERAIELSPYFGQCKIGLGAFSKWGPSLVRALIKENIKIFLDLKLHDIPQTVAEAVAALSSLNVSLITLHAAGGREMLLAAKAALPSSTQTKLVVVTMLTSLNCNNLQSDLMVNATPRGWVEHLANLAKECNLDGVVSSGMELPYLKKKFPNNFLLVTPGISDEKVLQYDQKRTCTPKEALDAGSGLLVIGRMINGLSTKDARIEKADNLCHLT